MSGYRDHRRSVRVAAVLFEVLLSIAIFTGAAMFTLRAVNQGLRDLDRTRREAQALDLARTTLAQLEAGLIDLADLHEGEPMDMSGSGGGSGAFDEMADQPRWTIETETVRTEFEGLSLLVLTVFEESGESFGPERELDGVSVTVAFRLPPSTTLPTIELMRFEKLFCCLLRRVIHRLVRPSG